MAENFELLAIGVVPQDYPCPKHALRIFLDDDWYENRDEGIRAHFLDDLDPDDYTLVMKVARRPNYIDAPGHPLLSSFRLYASLSAKAAVKARLLDLY